MNGRKRKISTEDRTRPLGKRNINILATINERPPWILQKARAAAEEKSMEGFRTLVLQKGYLESEAQDALEYARRYMMNNQDPLVKQWLDSLTPKQRNDLTDAFDQAVKLYYIPAFNASRDWEVTYNRIERFAKEVVNRYKPGGVLAQKNNWAEYGIRYWEVWNEPNFPCCGWITLFADPKSYAEVLAVAHRGIRSSDPGAIILFGGLSPDGYNPEQFIQTVYDAGKKDCFDVLNFHPYVPLSDYPKWAAKLKKLASDNRDAGKPIWFSERGAQTRGPGAVSESEQADILRQSYSFFAKGLVPAFFWYSFEESDDPITSYGIVRSDSSRKPAFEVLKNFLKGR